MDISHINKGLGDINIQEVKVNNKMPLEAQLVVSYTGQLVAGGIGDDPLAKFLAINEAPIHPELTPQEKQEALKTKQKPINYGIRIFSDDEIKTIEIKYKYFGISFVRVIDLDTWPE